MDDAFTFPGHWKARRLLNTPGWVKVLRRPREGERITSGEHYESIEPACWKPTTIIFNVPGENPVVANENANEDILDGPVGRFGSSSYLTLLDTSCDYKEVVLGKGCHSLDRVPSTP